MVRNATDLAAVMMDRGLSEARCYAIVRLGKWSNLTADELLQAMAYEAEFEGADDTMALWAHVMERAVYDEIINTREE